MAVGPTRTAFAAVSAALVGVGLTGVARGLLVGTAGATTEPGALGGAALVRFGPVTRLDVDDRTGTTGVTGGEAAAVDEAGLPGVGVVGFAGVVIAGVVALAGVVFLTGTGLAPRALHETVAPLAFTQCVATNAPAEGTNTVRPARAAKTTSAVASATSLTWSVDRP